MDVAQALDAAIHDMADGINDLLGREAWRHEGEQLGERERSAHSLMWDIGEWWNRGEAYGERAQIVTAGDWTGPTHESCRRAGSIAARFTGVRRLTSVSFEHHAVVAPLTDEHAIPLLEWCRDTDPVPTIQQLRTRVQQLHRAAKEQNLGAKILALPDKKYGVIYADPPWRLEPYSRETGLNKAADNHYGTMTMSQLLDMEVMRTAPAKDCVLFCWATVPMLPEALAWMAHYGFEYRSHCIWLKDRTGTGFWFRNRHELLLVGVRGDVPAPAPGTQYGSVIELGAAAHSAKPAGFAEMIEEMFPNLPALELFARGSRLGWDVWGNESQ